MKNVKILAALALAVMLAACASSHGIYNPHDAMPFTAQQLPMDQLEVLIVRGGAEHNWTMEHMGPGHLQATHTQLGYGAVVDITFDPQMWRIQYKSSTDRNHTNQYNLWLRNLELDIRRELGRPSK